MVLHSDYKRIILELTEEELILHRFFFKTKIKIENIRSAYVSENQLSILCNNNKIYIISIANLLWSDREKLFVIINKITKENILFPSNFMSNWFWIVIFFNSIFTTIRNLFNSNKYLYLNILLIISFIVIIYLFIKDSSNLKNLFYNLDKDGFEVIRKKDKEILFINRSDIEITNKNLSENYPYHLFKLNFKANNKHYSVYINKNIKFPSRYEEAALQLENMIKSKLTEKSFDFK
ncbi:hypothetical protein JCM1393_05710 [Clostridium carnis]